MKFDLTLHRITASIGIALLTLAWAWPCSARESQDYSSPKPNIVLIFCDDLGYADVGCYGAQKHQTPNIDSIATNGVRFTDFYVTSGVCTPSRSSLMTGCYSQRVDLHLNETGGWVLFPGNKKGLNSDEITIAELLKDQGYATGIVGKWHLGDQPPFLPTRHGFDYYFGVPFSNDMGETDRPRRPYPPLPLLRNEIVIEEEPDQRYLTQRYTHEATQFIKSHRDEPFFLYLPHSMPHWPQYSSEAFHEQSDNGKWGDCIEEIDWSTGRILETLAELGLTDNTLVIFMSDNGGALNHGASNAPLQGGKGSTWEGGHRVPFIAKWPKHLPKGAVQRELAVSFDLLPTLVRYAGGTEPQDRPIDGKNIDALLTMTEGAKTPHDSYFYYQSGRLDAVRSGNMKLFVNGPTRNANRNREAGDRIRLFDLENDIGESTNLAADHPDVVAEMMKLLEMAREDLGDTATERSGANVRKAGFVESATTLTKRRDSEE